METNKSLPFEVIETVADLLKEDCRQIRQAVESAAEENLHK